MQREANSWLYAFTQAPEAWDVCLGFLVDKANMTDINVSFMVTKVLQLKIRQQWDDCPVGTRVAVQEALITRLLDIGAR